MSTDLIDELNPLDVLIRGRRGAATRPTVMTP